MSAALPGEPDEPSGSGLSGDAEESLPQGLYVTAPAEDLSLEGFAADGRADTMVPGPLLAWCWTRFGSLLTARGRTALVLVKSPA
jgi:hypothetical protein